MGHFWSEIQDKYDTEENSNKGINKMTNDKQKGFTQVWEGLTNKPADFLSVIKTWVQLPEELIELKVSENGNLTLLVANEYIDWRHYRIANEFRPTKINNAANLFVQTQRDIEKSAELLRSVGAIK